KGGAGTGRNYRLCIHARWKYSSFLASSIQTLKPRPSKILVRNPGEGRRGNSFHDKAEVNSIAIRGGLIHRSGSRLGRVFLQMKDRPDDVDEFRAVRAQGGLFQFGEGCVEDF